MINLRLPTNFTPEQAPGDPSLIAERLSLLAHAVPNALRRVYYINPTLVGQIEAEAQAAAEELAKVRRMSELQSRQSLSRVIAEPLSAPLAAAEPDKPDTASLNAYIQSLYDEEALNHGIAA